MRRFSIRDLFWLSLVVGMPLFAQELPPVPADAKEVTSLLEKRWSLQAIREFCSPENLWDPLNQNLVLDGEKTWKGNLYKGKETGFDEIRWYASIEGNRIAYSLGASKGKQYWNLEIGDNKSLRKPRERKLVPVNLK